MNVAVYTLTRDRLDYTKHCFETLQNKAGMEFAHFVVDNGSVDGTQEWLKDVYQNTYQNVHLIFNDENRGISVGSNQALDAIGVNYDLIIKMDNDCEVEYNNIIKRIVSVYESMPMLSGQYMLSPRVEGIINQPKRHRDIMIDNVHIGIAGIVGGLFHCLPSHTYKQFRYDESLPKAQGQDQQICGWVRDNGGEVGYMEPIVVKHYETTDGQCARYPEYFERKWEEEKGYFK